MSDDGKVILFPTDRIKNKANTGVKNTKFQKQIEKEQTVKFVESAVDDIAMKLLHNFVDLAMKTNTETFTRDFSYLVDVLRATIKRDFGLNHIVHKIADNTVELIHDNAGNTRARIDNTNAIVEIVWLFISIKKKSKTKIRDNVFIGSNSGANELGSNKLYIDNIATATPLIYGDFSSNKVGINTNHLPNNVGGANTSAYGLYVRGGILTEEVRVRTGWADYVFDKNYELLSIHEVERFIAKNGHLPNVPSATQVENQGIELGDITRIQQEKIEELTLYIIKIQKQVDALEAKMNK